MERTTHTVTLRLTPQQVDDLKRSLELVGRLGFGQFQVLESLHPEPPDRPESETRHSRQQQVETAMKSLLTPGLGIGSYQPDDPRVHPVAKTAWTIYSSLEGFPSMLGSVTCNVQQPPVDPPAESRKTICRWEFDQLQQVGHVALSETDVGHCVEVRDGDSSGFTVETHFDQWGTWIMLTVGDQCHIVPQEWGTRSFLKALIAALTQLQTVAEADTELPSVETATSAGCQPACPLIVSPDSDDDVFVDARDTTETLLCAMSVIKTCDLETLSPSAFTRAAELATVIHRL